MAVGDKWAKLRGTLRTIFQLGIGGPNLKNNGGVVEVKNAADTAYADLRVKQLAINDADTNKVTIAAPALAADYTLTLPVDDGSPSQVLATDGSGVLSWATVDAGTNKIITDTTALAFGTTSPLSLFTLPANAVIHLVKVIVDTAFNGTAPTLSIGITGTTSKYMGTSDIDLKTVGIYEADPGVVANGSSEALIATYAADTSSAGAGRIEVSYSIPS